MAKAEFYGTPAVWIDPLTEHSYEVMAYWEIVGDRARPGIFQLRPVDDTGEVTQAVLRRCPADRFFEESREAAADAVRSLLKRQRVPARLAQVAEPRRGPGRPSLGDSHYQRVADLYWEALKMGGRTARQPNTYVLATLRRDGDFDSVLPYDDKAALGAVRRWVHRARELGFLPETNRTSGTSRRSKKG